IGYGAPKKAGTAATHGSPLGAEEIAGTRDKLGWKSAPFEVPSDVMNAWRAVGARGSSAREAWEQRWNKVDAREREAFENPAAARTEAVNTAIVNLREAAAAETAERATRVWSERALEALVAAQPALIGGSADL